MTDHILKLAAIIREVDGNNELGAAALAEAILSHPDSIYDQGVDDCWVYFYYELGMKDLAEEMRDWIYSQRRSD